MYEVDFLPVESDSGKGSKSGDAITMRFEHDGRQVVVVIDAGYSKVGDEVADHVAKYYKTAHVDLIISTHPDADHLNGIETLLERVTVGELLIHDPRAHFANLDGFSNLEVVERLIGVAISAGVTVTEPFAGLSRFDGAIQILGPTLDYYESQIQAQMDEERQGFVASSVREAKTAVFAAGRDLLTRAMAYFPSETLTDEGVVRGRNNSSVITLAQIDGERMLFTGDAGSEALGHASDKYEAGFGSFSSAPLDFFQAPHHGSKRNLGPSILNRMLGSADSPVGELEAFISSAKASEKHPSPKVVNALSRRGCSVSATEGRTICHRKGYANRVGWTTLIPIGPLAEDDD